MFPHWNVGAVRVGTLCSRPWLWCALLLCHAPLAAQEPAYLQLRINEVIASNVTVDPMNCRCQHVDMLEIYNPTDEQINLGDALPQTGAQPLSLRDNPLRPPWQFKTRHKINPHGHFVIFCDKSTECTDSCGINPAEALDEAHSDFALDKDGETVVLLGPAMELIDQVAYPPLDDDISYSRYPDGADTFVFTPKLSPLNDSTSFGVCSRPPTIPGIVCPGGTNKPGVNVPPLIDLLDYSTASPGSGEPVTIVAKVEDEKYPDAADLPRVSIIYRLDGGSQAEAPLAFRRVETDEVAIFKHWSIWEGQIAGQVEGTVVDFHLLAQDREGAQNTAPGTLCPWPSGPCQKDDAGVLPPECDAVCQVPYRYVVGAPYQGPLVMNEAIPENDSLLLDLTETLNCPDTTQHCHYDDLIELYNASDRDQDLSGLVLSAKPFHAAEGWPFPAGSVIHAGQHLIVWVDGDGKKAPNVVDPTDPAKQEFHTNFTLNGDGDEIFLFQPVDRGDGKKIFLYLDGLRWGRPGEAIDARDTFLDSGETWKYRKGQGQDPPLLPDPANSSQTVSWIQPTYPDASWASGPTGIGYGAGGLSTVLSDMQGSYLTVFCRKTFTIPNRFFDVTTIDNQEIVRRILIKRLYLEVTYDDGFIAYMNGEPAAARNVSRPGYSHSADTDLAPTSEVFDITPHAKARLLKGNAANVLAVEVHNSSLSSNDLVFNARLFWGIVGLGDDESLSRIPDGRRSGQALKVPRDYASPGAVNRSPYKLFRRGDAGFPPDGGVDISDAVGILGFLFLGMDEPGCLDAADVDDSGGIDIADAINLLTFLFQGGTPPRPPGPTVCGFDPGAPDGLVRCDDPTCN